MLLWVAEKLCEGLDSNNNIKKILILYFYNLVPVAFQYNAFTINPECL